MLGMCVGILPKVLLNDMDELSGQRAVFFFGKPDNSGTQLRRQPQRDRWVTGKFSVRFPWHLVNSLFPGKYITRLYAITTLKVASPMLDAYTVVMYTTEQARMIVGGLSDTGSHFNCKTHRWCKRTRP